MTGQWEHEGQMYTFHDTKGYLKDIQVDLSYVPDNTGENLTVLLGQMPSGVIWMMRRKEYLRPFSTEEQWKIRFFLWEMQMPRRELRAIL